MSEQPGFQSSCLYDGLFRRWTAGTVLHSNQVMAEKHNPGGPLIAAGIVRRWRCLVPHRVMPFLNKGAESSSPFGHEKGTHEVRFICSAKEGKSLYGNTRRIREKCVIGFSVQEERTHTCCCH